MQVIHRNIVSENQDPVLIQASNILSEWGFNKFRKYSYAPLNEYMCMLNPSGCTLVYKKDVDEDTKTDLQIFKPFQRRCECDYSNCYQIQCVHELSKYGKVIPDFFSKRWLRRDGNTKSTYIGSYKNPSTCDSLELTQECIDFEESGILDTWNNHDGIINVDENQNKNCNQILECNNPTTYNEDSMNKTSILPKVSKKLNYQDFSSILNQLFNACERNSEYASFVGGIMLKMLSAVDKHEINFEISDSLDDNLTNIFPSIIENYKCMFSSNSKSSNIANIQAPACSINSNFATNKRLMSTLEKKKRENSKRRKTSSLRETVSPLSVERNDIWETNMSSFISQEVINIPSIKPKKKTKGPAVFANYILIQYQTAKKN